MKAGWQLKKLGTVCGFQNGFAFKSKLFRESGYPILRISNIQDEAIETRRVVYFQLEDYKENLDKYRVVNGDLLIAMSGGTTGKIGFNTTDQWYYLNQRVGKFEPKDFLSKQYLFYFLSTRVEENLRISAGSAQPNLSTEQIKGFEIPVPPLPEQQRIVTILDKAFASIATAKVNAERNLQNGRALFESHLQSVFTQRGEAWVERQLGEIAEVQSGGTPSVSQKDYWGGGISWYSSGELNQTYTTHPERKITETGLNNSNAKLFPKGSLLVGMYDTAALKMSILDRDGAFNQAIAGLKPNDKIDVEFVLHAINADKPRLLLERRGVRQKNLSLRKIKEIKIPLPELSKQRAVVSRIRSVMAETQRLESIYQQKLAALAALKKSLLDQAFTGQL